MKKIVAEVAKAIPDTDIEIVEKHHRKKYKRHAGFW